MVETKFSVEVNTDPNMGAPESKIMTEHDIALFNF
jgi:hypothetical protein